MHSTATTLPEAAGSPVRTAIHCPPTAHSARVHPATPRYAGHMGGVTARAGPACPTAQRTARGACPASLPEPARAVATAAASGWLARADTRIAYSRLPSAVVPGWISAG